MHATSFLKHKRNTHTYNSYNRNNQIEQEPTMDSLANSTISSDPNGISPSEGEENCSVVPKLFQNGSSSSVNGDGDGNHDEVSEEQHLIYADYITMATIFPMALSVALELNLLGFIAKAGPGAQLSPAEIATQLPQASNNPAATASMLDRLLRVLASYSLLSCSIVRVDGRSERRYGLAPAGKYLVPDEDGVSLAPLLSLANHRAFRLSRGKLKDALVEGENPFNMAHGKSMFEYAASDAEFNTCLNTAMRNHSSVMMKKVLNKYQGFNGVNQLVEVAGGSGHLITSIVSKYPSIKAINFDLPHVIDHAFPYPGVEHVGGDMFVSVPHGDAILMKWIIHDWNDEMCIKLLKNCYASLPEKGKVIILEGVVPELPEALITTRAVSLIDIAMLTQTKDGKERTRDEFIALSNAAGFRHINFISCISYYWIIELYK